jgi:translation initiation factor IF-2
MAKSRLYEFAKALGLESKEVIAIASACGLERRISPSSTLDEAEKAKILSFIQDRRAPKQVERASAVVIRKARETKVPETLIEGPHEEPSSQESRPTPKEAAPQSASLPKDNDAGVCASREAEPSLEVEPSPPVEGEEAVPNEALLKEELSTPMAVSQEPEPKSQTRQVMEEPKEAEVSEPEKLGKEEKKKEKWVDLKKEAPKDHPGKAKKRLREVKEKDGVQLILEKPPEDEAVEEVKPAEILPSPKPIKRAKFDEARRRPSSLPPSAQKRVVRMEGTLTVGEMAKQMGVKASELIRKLIELGVMANVNQALDPDTAQLIAGEFRYSVENHEARFDDAVILENIRHKEAKELLRPPVVTIMGHVDHGKTTLLDAIRKSRVAETEAGGITQHIGAYTVDTRGGRITFLDTPGHEAFTAMRARGARVTDIAVLVVAADDGIMPQTIEAINHAKAAKVPIIVAINKVDKANANPDRVKQSLTDYGLVPDDWGGNTVVVPLSAKTGEGLDGLLELLLLQTELLELKARYEGPAVGAVIESKMDPKRGSIATVLVQEGTLKVGDYVVVGATFGKVRALLSDKGQRINEATPSVPVEILGLPQVPQAGELIVVMPDEREARRIAGKRLDYQKAQELSAVSKKVTLEDLYERIQKGEIAELNLVLKADTDGTVEALKKSLTPISHEKVQLNLVHAAVGNVSESDVMLASASNALVIGFNVKPEKKVLDLAQREKVSVRVYSIIYELLEDLKQAVVGKLKPEIKEVILGQAEIRQVFRVTKVGNVAGSYVTKGKLLRSAMARLIREGAIVAEGKIVSLKRFKEDVREVVQGYDCGVNLEGFDDYKEGDIIEAYALEEQAVTA